MSSHIGLLPTEEARLGSFFLRGPLESIWDLLVGPEVLGVGTSFALFSSYENTHRNCDGCFDWIGRAGRKPEGPYWPDPWFWKSNGLGGNRKWSHADCLPSVSFPQDGLENGRLGQP